MSSSPVIEFLFHDEWGVLHDALKMTPSIEVSKAASAEALSELLIGKTSCLILTSVKNKNDLIQLVKVAKFIKSREVITKIVVVNFSANKQIEKAINMLGIQDIIEEKINTKALKFKIDFWIRALTVQIKKNEADKGEKSFKPTENGNKGDEKKSSDHIAVWTKPIDCENDIWLVQNEGDCKKILTRWLVKLLGPSPYVGQWVEVPSRPGLWKFDLKPESQQTFMTVPGAWFYKSYQKPDYIWQENLWLMTGNTFELFHQQGEEKIFRLKLDEKILTIAKNSDYAKTKEQIIKQSFDKDLVFKRGAQSFGGSDSVDSETEKFKNLEGKGKSDQLQNKELSGKGKTSHIDTTPLQMDIKNGERGDARDPLTMKSKTNHLSFYLAGKNSKTDGPRESDASVRLEKHKEGTQLDLENKNNEYDKYLRNHNAAEKFDASDKLGKHRGQTSESPKEDYFGKSSTDKLSSHLGQARPDKEAIKKNASEISVGERSAAEKNNNNEKEKRDKLPSPTEAREEKLRTDAAAKKEPQSRQHSQAETPENNYDGKSKTDRLTSHIGSKQGGKAPEAAGASSDERNRKGEVGALATALKFASKNEAKPIKDKEEIAKPLVSGKAKNHAKQTEEEDLSRTDGRFKGGVGSQNAKSKLDDSAAQDSANLYAFADAYEDKLQNRKLQLAEDEELRLATEDAQVRSVIIKDDVRYDCNLDDFFDGKIIFSTTQSGLEAATDIQLDLSFKYQKKETKLAFEARIELVESVEDGTNYITVNLSEANIKTFDSFIKLYQTRQENVNIFLKRANGL